jgi:acyl-coenzyme A synthetase/AMP-(fatty) acid ligase
VVAYRAGRAVRVSEFLSDVERVVAVLGPSRHVLNACTDRYHFAVGFAAALCCGKVSLLPSTQTAEMVRQLALFAPDISCLTDDGTCDIDLPQVAYPNGPSAPPGLRHRGNGASPAVPSIDEDQLAAYVFTSGSTGTPLPYRKTFGPLRRCVLEQARRLQLSPELPAAILATVPPQHMYGFESSVLLPFGSGSALCAERPFYPADITALLETLPRPRILITTPLHLRALLGSTVALPAADLVVSSTAPLAQQLALEAEARFHTRLLEIYGSTETGQIAVRRPTQGPEWQLWPEVTLESEGEATWARGGHIEQPTRMWDVLERTGQGRFLLHGRVTDLVNIAGKRSSLAYLNHQLNSIPGVQDGAFFHTAETAGPHAAVARVAACVVAPELDAAQLLAALRERIDPAFLPRPLLFVAQLPRNATGKLPQEALRALAAAQPKFATPCDP